MREGMCSPSGKLIGSADHSKADRVYRRIAPARTRLKCLQNHIDTPPRRHVMYVCSVPWPNSSAIYSGTHEGRLAAPEREGARAGENSN